MNEIPGYPEIVRLHRRNEARPLRFLAEYRQEEESERRWVDSRYEGVICITKVHAVVKAAYGRESVSDIHKFEIPELRWFFDSVEGVDWKRVFEAVDGFCGSVSSSCPPSWDFFIDGIRVGWMAGDGEVGGFLPPGLPAKVCSDYSD